MTDQKTFKYLKINIDAERGTVTLTHNDSYRQEIEIEADETDVALELDKIHKWIQKRVIRAHIAEEKKAATSSNTTPKRTRS